MIRGTYPRDTTFGKRLRELISSKKKVAEKVIQQFIGEGSSVFIGDGSSTFFIGLYMINMKMPATVRTNHIAIANEYSLRKPDKDEMLPMSMFVAGGQINRDLMMTYDQDQSNSEQITGWAGKADCVILSVRSLSADRGPVGMEANSLSIKQDVVRASMENGGKIIFVVDHLKISKGYTSEPLVFRAESDWKKAMKSPNVYIVTTSHPNVKHEVLVKNPMNEEEWFQRNQWIFSHTMGKRYIEV